MAKYPNSTLKEKVQEKLKQKNTNLQGEISTLKKDKSRLQSEITELNETIEGLNAVIMEQIRVILDLTNQLKDILFEKIFNPTLNM